MSNKSNATIATMGIDIGKNSFHVVGLDQRGAIVLRQKWSRGQKAAHDFAIHKATDLPTGSATWCGHLRYRSARVISPLRRVIPCSPYVRPSDIAPKAPAVS